MCLCPVFIQVQLCPVQVLKHRIEQKQYLAKQTVILIYVYLPHSLTWNFPGESGRNFTGDSDRNFTDESDENFTGEFGRNLAGESDIHIPTILIRISVYAIYCCRDCLHRID